MTAAQRVLYTDIETALNVAHVWGLWNQNVGLSQLMESGRVMSVAWKWRGDEEVRFDSEFHSSRLEMLASAHAVLDEEDVVVHDNGKRFDIPKLNRDFVLAGMLPPAPFQQLDLLETVRRRFRFVSNKLDHVAKELGLAGKVKHEGHTLWVKCMNGCWECEPCRIAVAGLFLACGANAPMAEIPWTVDTEGRGGGPPDKATAF